MNKKMINMLFLGLLLFGGAIGAHQVMAQKSNVPKTKIAIQQQEDQKPLYHGSIMVDEAKYESISEQNESKSLLGLAGITADQAKHVAETKIGGTATNVDLGIENGILVYEVKVGNKEAKIDAGNGSILKIGQNDNDGQGVENKKGVDIEKDNINGQFER